MSRLFIFLFALVISGSICAQNAVLFGTLTDGGLNEPLPFATAAIEDLSMGTTTDLDGNYRLTNIPAGTHQVTFSYLGYESKTVEISFPAGSEVEQNIILSESGVMMNEVVVKGQATGQRAAINRQIKCRYNRQCHLAGKIAGVARSECCRGGWTIGGSFGI